MKVRNVFVALVAAAAMLFSSCNKDIDLQGTSWESSNTIDMSELLLEEGEDAAQILEMLGGKFLMDFNVTLDFVKADAGSMTMYMGPSASMNIPEMLKPLFEEMTTTETSAMTYTFDGEKGTITIDGVSESFTYNSKDKTITMTSKDLETIIGSSEIVFKQVK